METSVYGAVATGLVLLLLTLVSTFFLASPYRKLNLPPSPFGAWPIFGHLFMLGKLPHQTLWQHAQKHGPLLFLWLGSVPTVVASDPAMAREFLRTHDHVFASRPRTLMAKHLLYNSLDVSMAEYGPHWRHVRRICQYELLTAKRMEASKNVRREELMHMLELILKECEGGLSVDANHHAFSFPQNVITRLVLNVKYSGALMFKATAIQRAVFSGQFILGDFIPWIASLGIQGYERLMKAEHARMDAILEKILEDHKHRPQLQNVVDDHVSSDQNFIDVLLSIARDGKSEPALSDDAIKSVVLDMLLAGSDTTAVTLEWTLAEMLRNPREYEKVREELDRVVGRERIVEEEDIPNLKYLICCVKETFRLHPPAPFLLPHESTELVRVGGYDIPAKTRLLVNVWAIGRDPRSWDNPLEFRPERFVNMERDVRGQDYELLPFGSGRRGCPGLLLGLGTLQMGVAALLHGFDWSLPNKQRPKDLDMSEAYGLTMPKAVPLHAIASPRLPRHLYVKSQA